MDCITLKAYAKVNLSLDIVGKRPNGYHDVEMIMQQITLFDEVTLTKIDEGISITTDCKFIPSNNSNIACKVAKDIMDTFKLNSGIHIDIKKNIPVAAGLAGGSTDAAAVIEGMNLLFDLKMSLEDMKELAVKHGADIPFCIQGGAAIARGIGEELSPIKSLDNVWMVLCKPPISVSTQEVYGQLVLDEIKMHPDTQALIDAMNSGDYRFIAKNMYNVLEEVTARNHISISQIEKKLREYGAIGSMMSGSGPTVFGIFKNYKSAHRGFKNLLKKYRQVYLVQAYDGGSTNEQN
ncbi:MAG: 4-(cytidine 5'-diphospho)-2-C-methyl-D-erythritol kinase [Clostridia bacterium]|nr:4-(cytidine 5'-diphospho)-2-C-methyl-D-erythritol kinase [Clostridia bacterium]